MGIRDKIEDLEQQIYVACSEGDYEQMDMLENQLDQLKSRADLNIDEDELDFGGSFSQKER
ncbi:hypothetical protein QWZ04_00055 [Vibrio tapetis subsp. quintayensis]|uniref:hypothetical protein n=1 Tax=Vibrio tapetis TaxID=52443 RepID=UPI0025B405D0|nr:hypothetical protein [Vibrio tapetis]MDN3678739.1 hypothetical protein [Vibrio tapetis subsp. quintayensis]